MSNKFKKPHTVTYINTQTIQYRQGFKGTSYGLRALDSFNIYRRQIAQYKAVITKILKAQNKRLDQYSKGCFYDVSSVRSSLDLTVYPFNAETAKSQGSRMGKGKGPIDEYYFPVKAGRILFEISNVDKSTVDLCADMLRSKIPVAFRVVPLKY